MGYIAKRRITTYKNGQKIVIERGESIPAGVELKNKKVLINRGYLEKTPGGPAEPVKKEAPKKKTRKPKTKAAEPVLIPVPPPEPIKEEVEEPEEPISEEEGLGLDASEAEEPKKKSKKGKKSKKRKK
ncbi:MAG: hypothetical protein GWM98_04760 [Nitrospinaceae bacterium]|nr:hypothetical protein [Deltaproteobacteria bacterium]NIY14231.1 hypothetical protein [Nitrospinaceae bacterium]